MIIQKLKTFPSIFEFNPSEIFILLLIKALALAGGPSNLD